MILLNIKIVSPANARLKIARSLHSRSGIMKHGLFLMEGSRFVHDYMSRGKPEWVFLSEEATPHSREVAEKALGYNTEVLELPGKLFAGISDTEASQGIAAVCPLPEANIDSIPRSGVFLFLDAISDPGNMGTIIRSAAAFGCSAVIAGKGSCCPFAPKVTRASAGLNSVVPIEFDMELVSFMKNNADAIEFLGANVSGEDIGNVRPLGSCTGLVIGSEAHGISVEVAKHVNRMVSIPMAKGVDSLNAAVSASILLYHFTATVNDSKNVLRERTQR